MKKVHNYVILYFMKERKYGKINAESSSQIITSQGELFKERKERGAEKTITNITLILGFLFFAIAIIYSFI